ncbi:MAG: TetR/AcrR family transcriptional regulator [Nevskiales bacterium]
MKSTERAAHLGPDRRRPQVLDTALELTADHGLHGLSIDAIAQRMGVSRPVIYSCYASRDDILTALLAREEQRLFDGVMSALPGMPAFKNPEDVMVKGFQALLKVVAEHQASWKLVFASDPEPKLADRYDDARRRVAARVAQLMQPGLQSAGVKDIPRKLPVLVELFMNIGDAAVRSMINDNGNWTTDELGTYFGRLTLSAFKAA